MGRFYKRRYRKNMTGNKAIREFLVNQKDIAAMMWINAMKEEEANLVDVCYWNQKIIHWEEALKRYNEVHGKK